MRKPIRVTFVLPNFSRAPIGGYRVVFEYANGLASLGHQITIVFPRPLAPNRSRRNPFETLKALLWPLKTRLLNRPLIPWFSFHPSVRIRLVRAISDAAIPRADAILATAWQTADPVAQLSPTKGRKFYLIQHYETWAGPKDAVDATWRLPLRKIVIARWLLDIGLQLGANDITHIPNGIDFKRFKVINFPAMRTTSILSLYHWAEYKGVKYALEALRLFHARYPNVPITMFGTLPRGSEVPSWIQYVENPPQDNLVRDLYNGHAIYLGASTTEGWALPPAEAMACGCAFVGTDIGGFRDFAKDDETALLSPPNDAQGLVQNLCRLIDNPHLLRRIQEAGTANIQQFTWERATSSMEDLLTS